jgi:uncharacterized protein (TIGR02271 family)
VNNAFSNQVREGMDVYDVDGEKIGTIAESADGHLRVPSGFLGMGTEHRIPFHAISEVRGNEVHLSVSKDELDELKSDAEFDGTQVERTTTTASTSAEPPMREQTLELEQEELIAGKRQVQAGEVRLGKDVVSEQRTLEVPVMREEVTIERRPVERRPADQPIDASQTVVDVPLREEQVMVEKRPVVYEEVSVGKREVHDTERVSDTVRREEARIEHDGDADVVESDPGPGVRPRE